MTAKSTAMQMLIHVAAAASLLGCVSALNNGVESASGAYGAAPVDTPAPEPEISPERGSNALPAARTPRLHHGQMLVTVQPLAVA